MKIYNKLVRDNIPDIIRSQGKECRVRRLSDQEYLAALNAKLAEETNEYLLSGEVEELADLVEVVFALLSVKGYTQQKFETLRLDKQRARGAFERRLYLESVDGD